MENTLTEIAIELEKRFTSQIKIKCAKPSFGNDFIEVSRDELAHVVRILPNTGPGPDGVTSEMLKILFDISPEDLLNVVNYSLENSWIPPDWRLAKIIPLLKKQGLGMQIDNIRPIALTSLVV